jgi:hypothetical protein
MFQKYYVIFIVMWNVIVSIGGVCGAGACLLLVFYSIQPVSVLFLVVYSWLPQHHGMNEFHKR